MFKIKEDLMFVCMKAVLFEMYQKELLSFNEWYVTLLELRRHFNKVVIS